MGKFETGLMAVNRWALIGLLAAMSVIIFANVALRYLTHASIEWAEEVARHMMIWLTFLGAGPVLRYGGHIAIENLQDALPPLAARLVRWVVVVLLTGFFGFMVWYGLIYMERAQYQTTAATQISFAWIYAAMPIGGVLLLLHWACIVRGYLRGREFAADAHFDANASASL
ncbi:TRAP transporter small permease [Aquabacterium sp. OR-4]|uniref:TRAP transporter small permease n=1 Tax=Aquabacterium sp. OR-4 TaxID=2978127 RepID=UPI0021B395D5|nr:TRAP transporter small permease [Aquabacterium sp. OR-4]MDT7834427.1 TRAP transporter small permease [Aquabacterium sp. OR-4]